jgi:hypothetical protein
MSKSKIVTPCPLCGSSGTRNLTRKELRDRNDGKDPIVVVIPRTCTECGHVWDPPLSKGMSYLVAAVCAAGALLGAAIMVGACWILLYATFAADVGGANNMKNRVAVGGIGLLGLGMASWAVPMCRKYLRLARAQPKE